MKERDSPNTGSGRVVQRQRDDNPGVDRESQAGGKLRVLFVAPLPPPAGGIATWTEILSRRGLPGRFDIEIVNSAVARRRSADPGRPGPAEVARTIRILRGVRRHTKSNGIALMHLSTALSQFGVFRDWASTRMARRAGIPFVVHLRGLFTVPEGRGLRSRLQRRAYREMFEHAAAILPLNRSSEAAVLRLGDHAAKTWVIPNWIEISAMPDTPARPGPEGSLSVTYVGALIEQKGIWTILRAARLLTSVEFRLIGASPPKTLRELTRFIRKENLESRVHLMGALPHKEVLSELAQSDLFLFPSFTEGFPNSVAEAMAMGLPVVASGAGAIPEMIDAPRGGYLLRWDDVDACVERLNELRDNPDLRRQMGGYNREKARSEYDYGSVARRLHDLYSEILGV